jgi:AraC family transcriptional regulator
MSRCVAGHGRITDELVVDGIRATSVFHAVGALGSHAHDTAKLVVLVEGGATERIGLELVTHRPFEVVARGRLRPHENQYHACGARSIVVELDSAAALDGHLDPATARAFGVRLATAFDSADRQRRLPAVVTDIAMAFDQRRSTPSWLDAAREMLFERMTEPPSLVELGERLGVHAVHLAQSFRRHFGITPMGFVRGHRVFRAVGLIATGMPLARAAAEAGFADQSHMTRAISLARAAPPATLRRLMRPNPVQDRHN